MRFTVLQRVHDLEELGLTDFCGELVEKSVLHLQPCFVDGVLQVVGAALEYFIVHELLAGSQQHDGLVEQLCSDACLDQLRHFQDQLQFTLLLLALLSHSNLLHNFLHFLFKVFLKNCDLVFGFYYLRLLRGADLRLQLRLQELYVVVR